MQPTDRIQQAFKCCWQNGSFGDIRGTVTSVDSKNVHVKTESNGTKLVPLNAKRALQLVPGTTTRK